MIRHLLFLIIPLLCSCAETEKEKELIRVSVLRGPSAIAFASWIENPPVVGGRTIRVNIIDSPDAMQACLIKGEADLAVLPMTNAANLYNKGIDYPLLGCPIWGTLYLVGRDTPPSAGRPLHIFGAGTTPDILARHYIKKHNLDYTPNYAFGTPQEVMQGLLARKVETAVLSEPFLSMALRKDNELRILADLNDTGNRSPGFAQTAVVFHPSLKEIRDQLDSILALSCANAVNHPQETIRILEAKGLFAPGMLTADCIERCRIRYLSAAEAKQSITAFLELIYQYEPKAIGGKMPEDNRRQQELIPSLPLLIQTLKGLFASTAFYQSLTATVGRGIAGMLISFVVAVVMSLLFWRYRLLDRLFRPLLSVMRSVPVISFILFALIFLNTESIPLMIGFLTMFPLLTENLSKGIRSLHPGLAVMAHQFRIGGLNKLMQIIYPQLKPFLFSGLASAAGFGWRAIIMGEVLSQCSLGIGSEMKKAQNFIAIPELMAWTAVTILVSFMFNKAISRMAGWNGKILFAPTAHPLRACSGEEASDTALQLSDVEYSYGISHLSYQFAKERIYGISAPSGTGKTTLLNLINGTLTPIKGKITTDRSQGIASVFQEPELLPHLTAQENIALPLARLLPKDEAFRQAENILNDMELKPLAARYPSELSYGQQQRVAIARALVYPSPLLLMDEPFKGLDEALASRIILQIRSRQKESGQTVLFTSHKQEELDLLADEVIYMNSYL